MEIEKNSLEHFSHIYLREKGLMHSVHKPDP